ncbi:hypothetical protein CDV31_005481 [Fusarium ambrosium]|uniref:C6 zinc finger domain-containing protein n=1 Tax=Fusarium ambrosium TaxID=131363 RepID=A0A428UIL8_9HYPO|nr:hypothetical protein CDV31_005481 [Fusarium ambrosium]
MSLVTPKDLGGVQLRAGDSLYEALTLMHHFCTSTCYSLAQRKDLQHVWQVVVPGEAREHPFILHGVLAMAALHKAYLSPPDQRAPYIDMSAFHQFLGLEGFTACLSDVNKDNWRPVYCFSSMVILYVCCLPLRSSSTPPTPISAFLELMSSVRGIHPITKPFLPRILETTLSPMIHGMWLNPDDEHHLPSLKGTLIPHDVFDALQKLQDFLESRPGLHDKDAHRCAVKELCTLSKLLAQAGVQVESSMVFYWLYAIPDSIVIHLRTLQPGALLLLSYYCVFLALVDRQFWYLSGCARRLLDEIRLHLADFDDYQYFLQWPRKHIHQDSWGRE